MRDQLLARFPNHPRSPEFQKIGSALFDIADTFKAKLASIGGDKNLTNEGKRTEKSKVLPQFAAEMMRAGAIIGKTKRETAAKRAQMTMPAKDKADFRGAVQDTEIRQFLRELPVSERFALLRTTKDLRILEAALSAPPELSGMTGPTSEAVAKDVEKHYARQKFGDGLVEVEALEEVLSTAEMIAGVTRGVLRNGVNMSEREFAAIVGPAERAALPWLVGDKNSPQVCEPDPETGVASYRLATEWERSNGVWYANEAEWRAAATEFVADA